MGIGFAQLVYGYFTVGAVHERPARENLVLYGIARANWKNEPRSAGRFVNRPYGVPVKMKQANTHILFYSVAG